MLPLICVVLWSVLPTLAVFSGPDRCAVYESHSTQSVSPLLESLQCHNDFESHVHCKWREHRNTTLELWFNTDEGRKLCKRYSSDHRTARCRFETRVFTIGVKHTVFFLENKTLSLCSSVPHKSLSLFRLLKTRPPENLSTHEADDGSRRLRWSSPYPSSSSLNKNLTYQLSYRTQREESWTTEDVTNTSMKLEKKLLLPGHRYEARVRAWTSMGQWSDWSPVVTWQTKEDFRQFPTLHCVLDGDREVTCSWEVSRELAHFITYQLACRHNQIEPSERCCVNPTVSSDLSGTVLKYSCSLTVADHEHLLLDLLPTHNAKTFKANQHILPKPPQQVKVTQRDSNWIVEWTKPSTALDLYYEVCYYRTQDPESSVLYNIPVGSMYLNIPGMSLTPLQRYQVKVRSLVVPGDGSYYEGMPSEWTAPVDWTSNEAPWSSTKLVYIFISMFVAIVFFVLYCIVLTCQRKVVLWVDSVPSPGKSKILTEIKSASSRTLMQNEKTSICRVQHLDSISVCSSDALLCLIKDTEKRCLDQDKVYQNCDNLLSPVEKVNNSDTPCMSFSGPYVLCKASVLNSVKVKSEEKDKETPSDVSASPSTGNFTLYGDGYVCLPRRNISRSAQDLVSRSDDCTSTHQRHGSVEQDQQCTDTALWSVKSDTQPGLSESTNKDQPSEYTSGPFTSWPQGGTIQASGYCHLPTAFINAAK